MWLMMSSPIVLVHALSYAPARASSVTPTCNLYQWLSGNLLLDGAKQMHGGTCPNGGGPNHNCACYTTPWSVPVVPTSGTGDYWYVTGPKYTDGTNTFSPTTVSIKSTDGTRTFYHVDQPSIQSNKWIFAFEGGGSCGVEGGVDAFTDCQNDYILPAEGKEMSSDNPGSSGVDVPMRRTGHGILANGNDFDEWTRVWLYKTTYDRFEGAGGQSGTCIRVGGSNYPATVHFHGRLFITGVLNQLNRPNNVQVTANDIALPDLSNATDVMFVGQSGGAGGLIMNAEYLASMIATIAPSARVTFVIDARLLPDAASEGEFEAVPQSVWDLDWSGSTTLVEDDTGGDATIVRSYDTYEVGGNDRELLESWGDPLSATKPILDESCISAHAADISPCFDERHVLFHHFDEDVFLHQSLGDNTHARTAYLWVDTVSIGGGNLVVSPFTFDNDNPANSLTYYFEMADRMIYMGDELFTNRGASLRDDPFVANPQNVMGLYMVYGDQAVGNEHVTVWDDDISTPTDHTDGYYTDHTMTNGATTVSMHDALWEWYNATPFGDECWIQDATTIGDPEVVQVATATCTGWSADW